jgi:hypothetical protein
VLELISEHVGRARKPLHELDVTPDDMALLTLATMGQPGFMGGEAASPTRTPAGPTSQGRETMDASSPVRKCDLQANRKRSPGQVAATPQSLTHSPRPGSVRRVVRGNAIVGEEGREGVSRCNVSLGAEAKRRELSPGGIATISNVI